jgi:hypothetical protein
MSQRESNDKRRRLLQSLAAMAEERELTAALAALEGEFRAWRRGKRTISQLRDAIAQFQNGPAREIVSHYQYLNPDASVPMAVARGILKEEEIPVSLMKSIRADLENHRTVMSPAPAVAKPTRSRRR